MKNRNQLIIAVLTELSALCGEDVEFPQYAIPENAKICSDLN
jgi:hypothetical protein